MSLRVLVIPEDPTHNGYILKPLVHAILADLNRPRAKVTVLGNPRVQGYDDAYRTIIEDLPGLYAHMDCWLFMPDADRASATAMRDLEAQLERQGIRLLCCPAQPEVEIYACVANRQSLGATWQELRQHNRLKEDIFQPLLARHGHQDEAGGGRESLTRAALIRLPALYKLCPELAVLRDRLRVLLESLSQ